MSKFPRVALTLPYSYKSSGLVTHHLLTVQRPESKSTHHFMTHLVVPLILCQQVGHRFLVGLLSPDSYNANQSAHGSSHCADMHRLFYYFEEKLIIEFMYFDFMDYLHSFSP